MIASGGTFSIRRRKYWKRTSGRNKGPFASGCGTIVVFIMERALWYVDRWRFWPKEERDTNNLFYGQRAILADFSSRTDIPLCAGFDKSTGAPSCECHTRNTKCLCSHLSSN